MFENLKEIEETLNLLSKDLDSQLSASSLDTEKFHEQLINLISKYPDNKEIIQFIVFINDRIVTNQEISKDIMYETIKSLIHQKQILIKELLNQESKKINKKDFNFVEFFLENKIFLSIIFISISIPILLLLGVTPEKIIEIIKLIKGIIL